MVELQPSFDYLRTFVAVFRMGTFTSAAKFVGLSQPAVTSQMQALERQLGYPLFERHGRRIVPTARAQALAAEVAPHIDSLDAITDRDGNLPSEQARVIHIGGPAEYMSVCVIPLLAQMADQNVEFRVTFGLAEKLLVDLSVGGSRRRRQLDPSPASWGRERCSHRRGVPARRLATMAGSHRRR